MKKQFMNDDFLLNNSTAMELYHKYAENMPILDYHCHINPREIAENKSFNNITELWLGGDHYKWRALRSNGVEEKYITGDADDFEKFMKWAETVPKCIGNPIYHWTHLELRRYFGIDKLLSTETAKEIWLQCNKMLSTEGFKAKRLIEKSKVKALCTTDDPTDDLAWHIQIAEDKSFEVKVLPTFRPDKGIYIERDGFLQWVNKLEKVSNITIKTFKDLKTALAKRIEFFNTVGCKLSDHSLEPVKFRAGTEEEADIIFQRVLQGSKLSENEADLYKTQLITFLGKQYCKFGWVMQLHMGVIRNNNKRMFKLIGPDTGFDSIADYSIAENLASLLNGLEVTSELPKTILYCLNPSDNDILGSMIGNFQSGGIPGKIQFGSGWWFNDQKDGIMRQMTTLANLSLLSRFVGMLTDSRSLISYTRHEYFRRILCNMLGQWVEDGEVPDDMNLLGVMVQDICYNNAKDYFKL